MLATDFLEEKSCTISVEEVADSMFILGALGISVL